MNETKRSPKRKSFSLINFLVGAIALAVIFTAAGLSFAATQERHDSFCASCHTQPETTFYQRSTAGQPTDLASFHTTQKTGCIDCHSGAGIPGRVQAELMGAGNAAKWYSGTAIQPAKLTVPIADQNCMKCHADVVQRGYTPKQQITIPGGSGGEGEGGGEREGRNNHWHSFMARWQQAAPASAGTCVNCHDGHATGSTAQNGFMIGQNVQATCDACHQAIRREGEG